MSEETYPSTQNGPATDPGQTAPGQTTPAEGQTPAGEASDATAAENQAEPAAQPSE